MQVNQECPKLKIGREESRKLDGKIAQAKFIHESSYRKFKYEQKFIYRICVRL